MRDVQSLNDCISKEEKKKRLGVAFVSCIIWLIVLVFVISTKGLILLIFGLVWLMNWLMSEYNVRKLQAMGTAATQDQFPEIWEALTAVCRKYAVTQLPRVIIVNESQINAFALRFARKKVVVLLSKTLEGVLDQPDELRFFLGHEVAHTCLDHGWRGVFELYKPAAYKAARELTCDNCGCAASGNLEAAKNALKRLGVGNLLTNRLNEQYLVSEAAYIYSGFTGWLLKQYLTYPPLGRRLQNITDFSNDV
jgi:Zn-dependent protease with chaperone function